jgi:hypothetical protein
MTWLFASWQPPPQQASGNKLDRWLARAATQEVFYVSMFASSSTCHRLLFCYWKMICTRSLCACAPLYLYVCGHAHVAFCKHSSIHVEPHPAYKVRCFFYVNCLFDFRQITFIKVPRILCMKKYRHMLLRMCVRRAFAYKHSFEMWCAKLIETVRNFVCVCV